MKIPKLAPPKLKAPEPEPEPEIIEQPYAEGIPDTSVLPSGWGFYDYSSPGRAALEIACKERGLSWGVVKYHTETGGSGIPPKTKAMVLVGTLYEVEDEVGELDPLLGQLAASLSDGS